MKVRELIDKLSTFDPELPVVVSGYEGGYDDPTTPKLSIAIGRDYDGGVNGKYDREYFAEGEVVDLEAFKAQPWIFDDERERAFLVVAVER